MNNKLIIIGAGGHGKVAADCAQATGNYTEITFLDAIATTTSLIEVWSIVATPDNFLKYNEDNTEFFVAIGDNQVRQQWLQNLIAAAANIATLVHPSATVSQHAQLAAGCLICAQAVVNPFATMGLGCILNTGATLDHDCQVADGVHIAPGCHIAGSVKIGEKSFIGIGSSIVQLISVGKGCILGAGSVVVSDIADHSLAYGVPAKVVKKQHL